MATSILNLFELVWEELGRNIRDRGPSLHEDMC